jgi:hypothetical protein
VTGLTALLKIELPAHTAYLSDGGVTVFAGDTYRPEDDVLGALAAIEIMSEGTGQQIPALDIGFAAPGVGAIAALSNGAIQQSRVRLWIAEYDTETGGVVGTPDLRFIGIIDQPQISAAFRELTISISVVPEMEFLFSRPDGNELSASFHKALYAGETGHDNATGLGIATAWGVASPPRANTGTRFGGSSGGRGSGMVQY